jgi:hypothetical protein
MEQGTKAGVVAAALLAIACGPITTTRTETNVGRPQSRTLLDDETLVPVKSTWTASPKGFEGKLSWKEACVVEERARVRTEMVTERKANTGGNGAWLVVATGFAIGGIYTATKIGEADTTVYCSDPNDEETCSSEQGAYTQIAVGLIGVAGAIAIPALLGMRAESTSARAPVSSHVRKLRSPDKVTCGSARALEGLVVSVDIQAAGKWKGTVNQSGEVQIPIVEGTRAPVGVPFPVVIEEVPAALTTFLRPGQVIGAAQIDAAVASFLPQDAPKKAKTSRR